MKWLYLITILLSINFNVFAPPAKEPMTHLKTLIEIQEEQELIAYEAQFQITIHKDKISKSFEKKLQKIARKLEIPTDWLIGVMWHESRLNHKVVNSIGATGLIQILPQTAKGLGTTTYALRNMSPEKQLDYVYKFYKHAKGKFKHATDLYLYTFFPIAVIKQWPDSKILSSKRLSARTIAKANRGFDLNKDEVLTIKEIRTKILKYYE